LSLDLDCILVAVNTDLDQETGTLNIKNVIQTLDDLNDFNYQGTVILRSTLPIGPDYNSMFSKLSFKVEFVPEFLREGTSLSDFRTSEVLVIGSNEQLVPEKSFAKMLFRSFAKEMQITNIETAVYTKLLNNAWHSFKISFVNEAYRVGQGVKLVNSELALNILCKDKKLNISTAYMKPGGPFGGPCLIKDLKTLKTLDPIEGLFSYIDGLNMRHILRLAKEIIAIMERSERRKFKFDTYEFKTGTKDARSSIATYVADLVEELSESFIESIDSADFVFCGRSLMDHGSIVQLK
jgi:GDP-mannose 6-dehydrogenase